MDRLKLVFERHSGIENAAETAPEAVASAFVHGLLSKVQEQLCTIAVGWQTKPLAEPVTIANHCTTCQEKKKESMETKLMSLQLQNLDRGRSQNFH